MIKAFYILFAVLSLAAGAYAQTYYADVTIVLDASGMAQVSGVTNHPLLKTQTTDSMTSKRGSIWLFNLTLPETDVFSDYVYAVNLPPGASINYVKAESFRITESNGALLVSGSARDKPFGVVIQYQTDNAAPEDYSLYLLTAASFLVLAAAAFFFFKWRKNRGIRKKAPTGRDKATEKGVKYSKYQEVLTGRQKDILRILSEEGKPVNQASICLKLDLPKSSVSRNVAILVDLGLVEKKRIGMSSFLSLREE